MLVLKIQLALMSSSFSPSASPHQAYSAFTYLTYSTFTLKKPPYLRTALSILNPSHARPERLLPLFTLSLRWQVVRLRLCRHWRNPANWTGNRCRTRRYESSFDQALTVTDLTLPQPMEQLASMPVLELPTKTPRKLLPPSAKPTPIPR